LFGKFFVLCIQRWDLWFETYDMHKLQVERMKLVRVICAEVEKLVWIGRCECALACQERGKMPTAFWQGGRPRDTTRKERNRPRTRTTADALKLSTAFQLELRHCTGFETISGTGFPPGPENGGRAHAKEVLRKPVEERASKAIQPWISRDQTKQLDQQSLGFKRALVFLPGEGLLGEALGE
jgi:hypothetical protein